VIVKAWVNVDAPRLTETVTWVSVVTGKVSITKWARRAVPLRAALCSESHEGDKSDSHKNADEKPD
jgi:hypothetical protein